MKAPVNSEPSEAGREDPGAGAPACTSPGQSRHSAEAGVIEELAELHQEVPMLVREVILARERLDQAERWAGESFDEAASSGDENSVDRAVAAALECDHLQQAEGEATERWIAQWIRFEALLEQAAGFLRDGEEA